MRFLPLIWANLKRRKLRTALTVLSILVTFVLYGYLAAIRTALVGGISLEGANRLMVTHKVSIILSLPQSYEARMLRLPGVSAVAHQTWFGGIYQDPKNFFMQSPVVPEEFLEMFPEFLLPADQKAAWLKTRTGAIVGRKTANRYGFKVGDKVPIQSPIWGKSDGNHNWEFDIVGIFDGKNKNADTTAMFFRYDYFDEARLSGKGQVGWYTVRVKDPSKAPQLAKLVDEEFQNSSYETKTQTEAAMAQSFAAQIGDIVLITASILGAVFFTILLVTGNTMSQAVRERIGELGVLKAIGFTNVQVLGLVLAESFCVSLLGGGLGLGLAWGLISLGDPTGNMLPLFHLPARDLQLGVMFVVALGFLTGVFPAIHAMRLRVAVALRRM